MVRIHDPWLFEAACRPLACCLLPVECAIHNIIIFGIIYNCIFFFVCCMCLFAVSVSVVCLLVFAVLFIVIIIGR
jgi:hypothetical protein